MGAAFPPLPPVICKQQAPELEPAAALPPLPQPPLAPAAPIPPAQGAPSMDELIQQSQWNLQQQEQHLLALRQVRACSSSRSLPLPLPLPLRVLSWLPGAQPAPASYVRRVPHHSSAGGRGCRHVWCVQLDPDAGHGLLLLVGEIMPQTL